jgi:hypothetical protein
MADSLGINAAEYIASELTGSQYDSARVQLVTGVAYWLGGVFAGFGVLGLVTAGYFGGWRKPSGGGARNRTGERCGYECGQPGQVAGVRARKRTFMKTVATGELAKRLRNCVTVQLTENPERWSLGVLAFAASCGNELRAAPADAVELRARRWRSNSDPGWPRRRERARSSHFLCPRSLTS